AKWQEFFCPPTGLLGERLPNPPAVSGRRAAGAATPGAAAQPLADPRGGSLHPGPLRHRFLAPSFSRSQALLFLAPKLCLGAQVAKLRFAGRNTQSRALRQHVPKQSLGTRVPSRAWERE